MCKNGDWVSLLIATRLLDGMAGLVNQAISQFMEMIDGCNALVIMKCSSSAWAKAKDTLVHRHYIVSDSLFEGALPGIFIVFNEVFFINFFIGLHVNITTLGTGFGFFLFSPYHHVEISTRHHDLSSSLQSARTSHDGCLSGSCFLLNWV